MMSENTSKYILQVKDLHTTFSTDKGGVVKAVNGVSFNLEPGKILGLVGGKDNIASRIAARFIGTS